MARLKAEDLRNMTGDELDHMVKTLKGDLYKLRVEAQGGRVEKPHRISETRKNIARCHTIIKEKTRAR